MAAYPYRTIIDNEAESRSLVGADVVFAELGIASPTDAQTAQMETMIVQASGLIDRFLDRVLAEEDVTDYFQRPDSDTLRLSRFPVAEILGVIEDGTELTPDDWELDDATGQLWRLSAGDRSCWSGSGTTTVSYIGGYELPDDLPADIQRAAVDQVKSQFLGGSRDPNLRSFQVPDVYSATFSTGGGDSAGQYGLLAQVEQALAPHRRVVA